MHRDPTFDEVARREAKSCHGCLFRTRLWGVLYCAKSRWSGADNEKRCGDWKSGVPVNIQERAKT